MSGQFRSSTVGTSGLLSYAFQENTSGKETWQALTDGTLRLPQGANIKSGANERAFKATLVGGTVTVANTTVTANTIAIITPLTAGGTVGTIHQGAIVAGTSIVFTSSSGTDTSQFAVQLYEAPTT